MNKYLSIPFLILSFSVFSQTTVVYYSLRNASLTGSRFDPAKLQFTLAFNANHSIFTKIDNLETDNDKFSRISSIVNKGNLIFYKNLINKINLYNVQMVGERTNVLLNVVDNKWIITNETKVISDLKCFKATTTIEKYDVARKTIIKLEPVVWFSPEIPTTFGFQFLSGLPGLMIEGTIDGLTYFYATKILKNVQNITIEKPIADRELKEEIFDLKMATMYQELKSKERRD